MPKSIICPAQPASLRSTEVDPSDTVALPPYASHSISDTLFRCQSRPRHDKRADAIGYALLCVGALLVPATGGLSVAPGEAYFDHVKANRRVEFPRISRHLFSCVGAVATKERSEAIVDALVATGTLIGAKARQLGNADAVEAALRAVRPNPKGIFLSDTEKNAVREAFQIFLAESSRRQKLEELRAQTTNCLTRTRSAPPACPYACDETLDKAIARELDRLPSSRGQESLAQDEPPQWRPRS